MTADAIGYLPLALLCAVTIGFMVHLARDFARFRRERRERGVKSAADGEHRATIGDWLSLAGALLVAAFLVATVATAVVAVWRVPLG